MENNYTTYLIKDVIDKICMKHLNELSNAEHAFLRMIQDNFGYEKYQPLGDLTKSFKEWYEK